MGHDEQVTFRAGGRVGLLTATWPFFGLSFDRDELTVTAPFHPPLCLTRPQVLDIVPSGRGMYGLPCRLVLKDGTVPADSIWNRPKTGLAITERTLEALRRYGWPVDSMF
jgi:hypothetical protein